MGQLILLLFRNFNLNHNLIFNEIDEFLHFAVFEILEALDFSDCGVKVASEDFRLCLDRLAQLGRAYDLV